MNLRFFPFVKLFSAILFIIGGILTYIFSIKPEVFLFQIGGVDFGLILGLFPIITGIGLIFYTFLKFYKIELLEEKDSLILKAKQEIKIKKDEIVAVRIRDAGKAVQWFIFLFVNFYFVYYGIECALYFSANHNTGFLKYVIFPMFLVWCGGFLLLLFPRKLLKILTNDMAILQKITHIPNDNSFENLVDRIFGFEMPKERTFYRNFDFVYRVILGLLFLIIFLVTSLIVEFDDINQPLHDLGIFIPIFLLFFSVLMFSSALTEGFKRNLKIQGNKLRIEEKQIIHKISGKNYLWVKTEEKIDGNKIFQRGFRNLNIYNLLLVSILFGQGVFLAFKFLFFPNLYIESLNWIDIIIGVSMLLGIFLYSFEVIGKIKIDPPSEYQFNREIQVDENVIDKTNSESRKTLTAIKQNLKNHFKSLPGLIKQNKANHTIKVFIAALGAVITILVNIYLLGFLIFIFI